MRRSLLAMLLLLAGIASSGRAGAAPPAGSIGIRLLEAPADAKDDPRAQVHIVDHLAPGIGIARQIEVNSTASTPTSVELYGAAASIVGTTFTGADGRTVNDLSSWTSVSPATVVVPAGGSVRATVTVDVPVDAAPGEQYGVVWAEARSTPDGPGAVTQISRVGIRLYVLVGPGGAPAPDFEIRSLTAQRDPDGAPGVLVTVRNTGGRALDLTGTMELTDGPGGLRAGPFPVVVGTTLAIGDTSDATVLLSDALPAGPWTATVELRSGRVERHADATITFPAAGEAAAVPVTEPRNPSRAGLTWAGVAFIVLVVVAAALWRRRTQARSASVRSRKRRTTPRVAPRRAQVPVAGRRAPTGSSPLQDHTTHGPEGGAASLGFTGYDPARPRLAEPR